MARYVLLVFNMFIVSYSHVRCFVRIHSVILVIISLLFGLFVLAIGCDQVGVVGSCCFMSLSHVDVCLGE